MRVSLTHKGRAMREPLEEMWSELERASVGDLDARAVERFIATSEAIRRAIADRDRPACDQARPAVSDGRGQVSNQNQEEEVQI